MAPLRRTLRCDPQKLRSHPIRQSPPNRTRPLKTRCSSHRRCRRPETLGTSWALSSALPSSEKRWGPPRDRTTDSQSATPTQSVSRRVRASERESAPMMASRWGSPSVSPWDQLSVSEWDQLSASRWDSPSVSPWGSQSVSPWDSQSVLLWGSPLVLPWDSTLVLAMAQPKETPSDLKMDSTTDYDSAQTTGNPLVSEMALPTETPSVSLWDSPLVLPWGSPSVSPWGSQSVSPWDSQWVSPWGTPSVLPWDSQSVSPSVRPSWASPSAMPLGPAPASSGRRWW